MALRRSASSTPAASKKAPKTTTSKKGRRGAEAASRTAQLKQAFSLTRKRDPRLVLWMLVAFLVPLAVGVLVGVLTSSYVIYPVLGLMVGIVAVANVFGRRAQKAAYAEVEGQPGVAVGIVSTMRGDWRVTPAVQFNKSQDLVHRVVCRAGVVLLAEGSPRGARELMGVEVRRVRKVIGDTPLYDIVVGDGEGEVPIKKLSAHLNKLPRSLKEPAVNALDRRLKAIGGANIAMPKGPMPTHIPRGKIR